MSLLTPSDIQYSAATQIWGCYRLVSKPGYREPVVMYYASSAVTYTSVYIDSEPSRVFWGADEEISDGGIPRVIYEDDETEDGPVDYPMDGGDDGDDDVGDSSGDDVDDKDEEREERRRRST
ncbi:hypothetical protein Tco_1530810 [Tanacetum coccineum]